MKLTLPRFGLDEVEIDPASLIEFPNGMPGFEDCKRFKLFHSENNLSTFWLLSVDDPNVVFSITDPESLGIFYKMTLTDEELSTLRAEANDELQVVVLLGYPGENEIGGQKTLQAFYESPIVINVSRQTAVQKILHFAEYSIAARETLHETPEELSATPALPDVSQMHFMTSQARHPELVAA